jgi:hypothetical protein
MEEGAGLCKGHAHLRQGGSFGVWARGAHYGMTPRRPLLA